MSENYIELLRTSEKVYFLVIESPIDDELPNVCCFKTSVALYDFIRKLDEASFAHFKIYEGTALIVAER